MAPLRVGRRPCVAPLYALAAAAILREPGGGGEGGPGAAAAAASAELVVEVPGFVDCTESQHADWAPFRELFRSAANAPGATNDTVPFPGYDPELLREALRLHQKWRGELAKFNEDYPPGAAKFYHSCHFDESSPYCLYGHVAVLAYLSRYVAESQAYELTRAALRLLGWTLCLDFLESSTWGFSLLDLWDKGGGFEYPQVSLLHQAFQIGEGTAGQAGIVPATDSVEEEEGPQKTFWIFEFGTHRALSNEPVSMLRRALPDYEVVHQNYMKPYEGRAEAFRHPFPRECSPNCRYQQDSVPYTFPIQDDMEESARGYREFVTSTELRKPAIRRASIFLCTNPIYYCNFFAGLNRTVLGYFGLPLLYMVPKPDWAAWVRTFADMAASSENIFFANNPLLAEQVAWQSGARLPVLRPLALYLEDTYYPTRINDILVPEPREACVLNCLLKKFTPSGYPLRFFEKADTDRTFRTFSSFRAIVLFPHDYALMSFYEFYAMAVPLFVPGHLSKYLFPYSATVPLLDWVPKWLSEGEGSAQRPAFSPLSLTSVAALQHWSKHMDFFLFPALQRFPSIAGLLQMLPKADVHAISVQMRDFRLDRLLEATPQWEAVAAAALAAGGAAA